jgi:MFS family permease
VEDGIAGARPHRPARRLVAPTEFGLLWTATTLSQLAVRVGGIAISLLAVTAMAATPVQMGLLTSAQNLGMLLVGLPAGAMIDRYARRRMMARMDGVRAALVAGVAVAWWAGVLTWPFLLATALAASIASVFFDVAQQAYLPSVVARAQLVRANTRLQGTSSILALGGSTLGGVLVGVLTAAGAILAGAVGYLASALTLRFMRGDDPLPTAPRTGMAAEIRAGFGYVWRDRALRAIALCTATGNLFMSAFIAVMVLFLVRDLHVPAYATGLVVAGAGIGGVAAATTTRRWVDRIGQARTVVLSLAVTQPFALLAPLAAPGWRIGLFAAGWFITGYGSTLYNISQVSYRQAVCPGELLGRVNASNRFLAFATPAVGALLGGVLADWTSPRTTLLVAAAGLVLGVGWLLASPLAQQPQPALGVVVDGVERARSAEAGGQERQ